MSGCSHEKCLRDGCKVCCYCTANLKETPEAQVYHAWIVSAPKDGYGFRHYGMHVKKEFSEMELKQHLTPGFTFDSEQFEVIKKSDYDQKIRELEEKAGKRDAEAQEYFRQVEHLKTELEKSLMQQSSLQSKLDSANEENADLKSVESGLLEQSIKNDEFFKFKIQSLEATIARQALAIEMLKEQRNAEIPESHSMPWELDSKQDIVLILDAEIDEILKGKATDE